MEKNVFSNPILKKQHSPQGHSTLSSTERNTLPPLYINVMLYIAQFPQFSKNQRDVEHFLDLSNPTVTKLLKSMEKERWILRKFDQSDFRKKLIGLTEKSFVLLSTEYE